MRIILAGASALVLAACTSEHKQEINPMTLPDAIIEKGEMACQAHKKEVVKKKPKIKKHKKIDKK